MQRIPDDWWGPRLARSTHLGWLRFAGCVTFECHPSDRLERGGDEDGEELFFVWGKGVFLLLHCTAWWRVIYLPCLVVSRLKGVFVI